jgi:hypothetical protein
MDKDTGSETYLQSLTDKLDMFEMEMGECKGCGLYAVILSSDPRCLYCRHPEIPQEVKDRHTIENLNWLGEVFSLLNR